ATLAMRDPSPGGTESQKRLPRIRASLRSPGQVLGWACVPDERASLLDERRPGETPWPRSFSPLSHLGTPRQETDAWAPKEGAAPGHGGWHDSCSDSAPGVMPP